MELHIWPTARYMRKELRHDTDVYECVFISPTDAHPVSTNNILIYEYIQKYATLHSLFYLEIAVCAVGDVRHPQHTQTSFNSSTIAAGSSNGATNTRFCRYSCMRS